MAKFGISEIIAAGKYGMPKTHMEAILDVVQKTDQVIGVRGVNPLAQFYINQGCPTKPFAVKNKSAKNGVAAGLIVIDIKYGRDVPNDAHRLKHQKNLENAYRNDEYAGKENCLQEINLQLSQERIDELIRQGACEQEVIGHSGHVMFSWSGPDGKVRKARGVWDESGQVYNVFDEVGTDPVKVLGRVIDGEAKPITADYDLLVVAPSWRDYGTRHITSAGTAAINPEKTPFRTQGDVKQNIDLLLHDPHQADARFAAVPAEDQLAGNWNERTRIAVQNINSAIAAYDAKRDGHSDIATVHHNAEFLNPFADTLEGSMPCLMVLPKPMDVSQLDLSAREPQQIILIENKQELIKLREIVQENGYYFPMHAKYKNDMKPAFAKQKEALERTLRPGQVPDLYLHSTEQQLKSHIVVLVKTILAQGQYKGRRIDNVRRIVNQEGSLVQDQYQRLMAEIARSRQTSTEPARSCGRMLHRDRANKRNLFSILVDQSKTLVEKVESLEILMRRQNDTKTAANRGVVRKTKLVIS